MAGLARDTRTPGVLATLARFGLRAAATARDSTSEARR
jgi:hypothetical protein